MNTSNPALQLMLQKSMQAFTNCKPDLAESILKGALQDDINSADIIFELGIAYANSGKFIEALTILDSLQIYKNADARIPYNLGLIYSLRGNHILAIEAYESALKIQPDFVEALINKGSTYIDIKKFSLAIEVLEKAIQIRADIPEAWCNLGIALNHLNFQQESLGAYHDAIKLNPNYHEAWSNMSVPLNKLKRFLEASQACDHALSLKLDYAEAWSNKGNALSELRRYDEAIAHFEKALSLKPDYAEAWSNKGNALSELRRYNEAIAHFEKALSLRPDIDWLPGFLIHTKMKICSWSDLAESLNNISTRVMASEKVANPFLLLALNDDTLMHKRSSEIYIQSTHPLNPVLGPIIKHPKNHKIKLGYFSADFHNHATGHLMAELFELHDKNQFELTAFSFGPLTSDEMRQRLRNSFDQFIEVGDKTDIEIAKLSRDLNIDIAIDLKGFTEDSRAGIFSYRAAPIQANYLGYPGTMGAEYIDYIIGDQTVIPPELQNSYTEKVVYLPGSYQVNDRKRVISNHKFTKHELGLPEQGFVFCCFNNNYKILPDTFASWMRILHSVEGSILWLFQDNPWAVKNLKREALNYGISANRLVFGKEMPLAEHLARHHQADLFLDTWPYNAHTTASDALWTGLPVLSLIGDSFASRVAASLLNAIGLAELITYSENEYEALAIELAMNPKKLTAIKSKLVNNRQTTPLFNTPCFTKNLEAAFIKMHGGYLAGFQPDHIS
ncbi:tetratricopeptide repeat protein [Polynucleobacter sp. AP-Sving-400A-A2]|uniref:O-linked N-acetylglucosamine transferase family protein n=1 Tax=Polynucleobacter sp. AP-Sving-400A-A2 TaxID=2081049 RepID=UPI001BFE15EA|nr:tetratricopeptide repeat protein [Polynucleobacter sp. AP-Sving-400A-A2]QWE14695.1 tetratricopeptide repeat protein [Polynucleobacter sp. AP-Sving-400A-A2]